jgi:hypothetical protein
MVETVGFRQVLWLVMLKSTKNQILGVYTPGQQVPLRVRYGTTCLVITDPMGSVPCSDEWEVAWSFARAHMVQDGLWYRVLPRKTLALLWYRVLP